MTNTPVLFLIFNRPELTLLTFDKIRSARPKKLYVAADGPRPDKIEDIKNCYESRENVLENIDWECELKTLFRAENLGCGRAVSNAITWFFSYEEKGIILEDDCLPTNSFFLFCENLLERYRDNPNVMMVSGTSYQSSSFTANSYYFSKYIHVWGWATWRRAWQLYDFKLRHLSEDSCRTILEATFQSERERTLWLNNFKDILSGFDTWDYQWMFCVWKNNGLCAIPWRNMISNIGFGANATHTTAENSYQAKMKQFELFEITHPHQIAANYKADKHERYLILISPPVKFFMQRIRSSVKKVLNTLSIYK